MVVNTTDGMVWTRRAVTRGGLALYAPEGVCQCPEYVMATEAELAEHGISGSVDVLPVPVGPAAKDVTPQVTKLRNLLAGQRAAVEGEHYVSVHHDYRVSHDLPETGGA